MTPPRKVSVDPVAVEDETYIGVPTSLSELAQPAVAPETAPYFEGLAQERLVLQHCDDCGRFTHYPVGGCQWCGSAAISHQAVDGRGTLYSFSVSYRAFGPGLEAPYVVAFVELDLQPGLQLVTNLVDTRIADLRIGMPVVPCFVHDGEVSMLFYRPAQEDSQ